ncbi:putative AlkP superfamily pyrophosphatase or phosphodiesterase [Sphingomonas zeicaulis]|uniref:alkaline phosphatase family protein n=1 Tax=Sphingomonas zeicaulis TaxID=1632740 RepID=UPI003D195872
MIGRYLVALFAALALSACSAAAPPRSAAAPAPSKADARAPVTILISIDGFRPDYLKKGNTPTLDALVTGGVSAAMRPSFPSKTFPNHWTLVTGLRPDHHGIVANKMQDPARPGEVFTMSTEDPFWWNAAPPLWVTAEEAGVRTGTMFWPGSVVNWGGTREPKWPNDLKGGIRPHDWQAFAQAMPSEQRTRALVDWLRRPADARPLFLTLYFDAVDTAGHRYGPAAAETAAAVTEVDSAIAALVEGLRDIGQPANLVIVADHGMAAASADRIVRLDRMLPAADIRIVEDGVYAGLFPASGREAAVEKVLIGRHPHMECWRKADIPARFHYGTNIRIPPILCLADLGWRVVADAAAEAKATSLGEHGYDNALPDMAALFIVNGPAFRAGATLPGFDNVDVYPLLAKLIGVAPAANDGSAATFDGVMAR